MQRNLWMATIVAICALLCACPELNNPVSDPAASSPDPALYGVWRSTQADGTVTYLHIGPGPQGMQCLAVGHEGDKVSVEQYDGFVSRIGRLELFNVILGKDDYTLLRYEVSGPKLTLWILSDRAVNEDVRAGRIAGEARYEDSSSPRLTASTEELARYVELSDEQRVFEKLGEFRRVR